MKSTARLFASLALLLATSCSTTNVRHDYVDGANFTSLKTFAWMPAAPARDGALFRNTIVDERIHDAVDRTLASKGFVKNVHTPDFLVATHIGAHEKIKVQDWGYGYRRYGFRPGVNVQPYQEGVLILDVFDARSKQLIWRGVATKTLDQRASRRSRVDAIDETVAQILADFPPKGI